MRTSAAPSELLAAIRALADDAFDGAFTDDDWAHALGGWHAVVLGAGGPLAHAAVVPRVLEVEGRPLATGYVEAVATAPGLQGRGLGSAVVVQATALVRRRFALGALSTGRPGFYQRLGWERWQGPTFVRLGSQLVRTEDDDDGLLVLRHGPHRRLDRCGALSCDARPGDPW